MLTAMTMAMGTTITATATSTEKGTDLIFLICK